MPYIHGALGEDCLNLGGARYLRVVRSSNATAKSPLRSANLTAFDVEQTEHSGCQCYPNLAGQLAGRSDSWQWEPLDYTYIAFVRLLCDWSNRADKKKTYIADYSHGKVVNA